MELLEKAFLLCKLLIGIPGILFVVGFMAIWALLRRK
jgi:hypothetical protein